VELKMLVAPQHHLLLTEQRLQVEMVTTKVVEAAADALAAAAVIGYKVAQADQVVCHHSSMGIRTSVAAKPLVARLMKLRHRPLRQRHQHASLVLV
jgi:hypothetical protein